MNDRSSTLPFVLGLALATGCGSRSELLGSVPDARFTTDAARDTLVPPNLCDWPSVGTFAPIHTEPRANTLGSASLGELGVWVAYTSRLRGGSQFELRVQRLGFGAERMRDPAVFTTLGRDEGEWNEVRVAEGEGMLAAVTGNAAAGVCQSVFALDAEGRSNTAPIGLGTLSFCSTPRRSQGGVAWVRVRTGAESAVEELTASGTLRTLVAVPAIRPESLFAMDALHEPAGTHLIVWSEFDGTRHCMRSQRVGPATSSPVTDLGCGSFARSSVRLVATDQGHLVAWIDAIELPTRVMAQALDRDGRALAEPVALDAGRAVASFNQGVSLSFDGVDTLATWVEGTPPNMELRLAVIAPDGSLRNGTRALLRGTVLRRPSVVATPTGASLVVQQGEDLFQSDGRVLGLGLSCFR